MSDSRKPTHVIMLSAKGDKDVKAIYPVKGWLNFDDEFDARRVQEMRASEVEDYILDHVSFNGYTRQPGEQARDQRHPIDKILDFLQDDLGNNELQVRIMREKPYEGGGGGGGRGSGRDSGRRDEGRSRDRGGRDDAPRDRGRDRGYDDEPRRDRDEGHRDSRRQSYDPPDRGYSDRDADDDPFNEE